MKNMRASFLLICALVAIVLLFGCSGQQPTQPAGTPSTPQAQPSLTNITNSGSGAGNSGAVSNSTNVAPPPSGDLSSVQVSTIKAMLDSGQKIKCTMSMQSNGAPGTSNVITTYSKDSIAVSNTIELSTGQQVQVFAIYDRNTQMLDSYTALPMGMMPGCSWLKSESKVGALAPGVNLTGSIYYDLSPTNDMPLGQYLNSAYSQNVSVSCSALAPTDQGVVAPAQNVCNTKGTSAQ